MLAETGADGVMIGRGAQGNPWLFGNIRHFLDTGTLPPPLPFQAACDTILTHLNAIHDFYGEIGGVRMARKHIAWYVAWLPESETFRKHINKIDVPTQQFDMLSEFLQQQSTQHEFWLCDATT